MAQRRKVRHRARGRLGLVPPRAVVVAAVACAVLLLGVGALAMTAGKGVVVERSGGSGQRSAATDAATPQAQTIVVDVDGAVAAPGVYDLSVASPRVRDAIAAAGGLAEDADTSTINMAALVVDASKVHVPRASEQQASGTAAGGGSAGEGTGTGGGAGGVSNGLVNINSATSEELQTLSGVGEATANAIIRDREANGPFASIEDLMRVSGIGQKKFAKISGSICV